MKKWFYKRWICLILCFGLILPQGLRINSSHVVAAQTGTVKASSLNVRTSPSTTASRLQTNGTNVFLLRGETVNILGQENGWYHVSLNFNGRTMTGYVHGDFLEVTGSVSPTPTAKPTVTPKPTATPKPAATPKPTAAPKPVAPTPFPANHDPNKVVNDFEHKAIVTASSLNVRRGPGTTFARITGLSKGQSVVVLNEVMIGNAKWYRISFQNGSGNTGYVLSDFIKLNFAKTVKGRIAENKLRIRSSAGSKGAFLKDTAGNIIALNSNKAVTITDDVMISNEKWFKLSFSFSGKKYVGYALANQVRFETQTPKATPTPKASATPTPMASVTPVPTPVETPTPVPTTVPTKAPTPTIGAIPTSGAAPTPSIMLEVPNIQIYTSIRSGTTGYVCNTIQLNIVKSNLAKQDLLYDDNNQPIILNNGDKISVLSAISFDNIVWYQIQRDNIKGYVRAEYIYVGEEPPMMQGPGQTPTPTQPPWSGPLDDAGFELKLVLEGFPESYKEPLRKLRQLNPTWEFKAYHTGLDWNAVIREQSIPGKNLLPNNKSIEWKSLEAGAYNWRTDSFIVYDGSTWVTASKAAIEYYMDPRNFLDDRGIFQFELLSYQNGYQNTAGVENILKGTALFNNSYTYTDDSGKAQTITYGETFIKAAEYSGVSPYHLASRVKQEVVTGPTTLSNSVSGTVAGYEGLYNFFNIGAHDSTAPGGAIANGLRYAQNGSTNAKNNALYLIPWINQYKSIVGGSYFIGNSYINRGQNTVYLQKFNVTPISTHFHQYMTNVEAPFAEAKKICVAYSNMKNTPIVFSIPVYHNLPTNPVPAPKTQFNPNNWLKSLKVFNVTGQELTITPTFSQTERNYNLIVANSVDIVNIKAATVSNKATLSGTGDIQLKVGNNKLCVTVIAENGDRAEYIINIVREN